MYTSREECMYLSRCLLHFLKCSLQFPFFFQIPEKHYICFSEQDLRHKAFLVLFQYLCQNKILAVSLFVSTCCSQYWASLLHCFRELECWWLPLSYSTSICCMQICFMVNDIHGLMGCKFNLFLFQRDKVYYNFSVLL